MPSPSESLSAGRSVITASVEPMRSAAAPAAAAARTTCRERSTEPSLDSMGAGAYKELILRFSKLRGRARARARPPPRLPRTGAPSFADDFSEGHASVDLRDADLDLVPDLRPRDEDHEVRNPRESVAFPSDIFDLGLVHLPLLHRDVRRSEARPRIRHPQPHAVTPLPPPRFASAVRYIMIYGATPSNAARLTIGAVRSGPFRHRRAERIGGSGSGRRCRQSGR